MTAGNVNYNAVLADLEGRRTQIESAIAAVKNILASAGVMTNGTGEGVIRPDQIPTGAFLRLSIADATKKFLDMVKTKQSVPRITEALEKGGLPPAKNNTVYAVLRRREKDVGDIIRVGDEWALTEWYPNNPNLRKRPEKAAKKPKAKKANKKKAPKPQAAASDAASADKKPTKTKADAIEEVLKSFNDQSVHAKVIADVLTRDYGMNANEQNVAAAMFQDPKKRFKNIGKNTWKLVEK